MNKEIDVKVTGDIKAECDYKNKYYDLKLRYWILYLLFIAHIISDILFYFW